MNRLTDKIGIDIKNDMFFVEHISEDVKTSSVCYSENKNYYTKKLIEFGSVDSEYWAKILNGRDFSKLLEDMIKNIINKH